VNVPADLTAGLRSRWILAFVFGELVGFIPPAVVGATLGAAAASAAAVAMGVTVAALTGGALIALIRRSSATEGSKAHANPSGEMVP
jgi:hypothetical protein